MKSYTDGACRVSNPGQCSCAWAIFDADGLVQGDARYLGPGLHTNNYAEYNGLLDLLKWADLNRVENLDIYCDSKLVVNQVIGVWGVKHEEIRPLCSLAQALYIRGKHVLHHVKGHNGNPGNEFVDKLCNEILDKELGVDGTSKAQQGSIRVG